MSIYRNEVVCKGTAARILAAAMVYAARGICYRCNSVDNRVTIFERGKNQWLITTQ